MDDSFPPVPPVPHNNCHASNILSCMSDLRHCRELCDVILEVENREFHAHRVVLAASSPYFRAMFTSGLSETQKTKISLRETDPCAVEAIVDFAYTSRLIVNEDNASLLLQTADCFQFVGVRKACCDFLERRLTPENCLAIEELAERHSCSSLRKAARDFTQSHFAAVATTDGFLECSLSRMLDLVDRNYLNVTSEDRVADAVVAWVNHNAEDRRVYLSQLLAFVRLPFVSPRRLTALCDMVAVVEDDKCRLLMEDVVAYCSMPTVRRRLQCRHFRWSQPRWTTGLSQVVVVAGGQDAVSTLSSVERYCPLDQSWSPLAPMESPRYGMSLLPVDGRRVCALGGYNRKDGFVMEMEWLNMDTKKWQRGGALTKPRRYFGAVEVCSLLYIVGGSDSKTPAMDSVQRYDPGADVWYDLAPMSVPRMYAGVAETDGFIFAVGGHDGKRRLDSVECYNLETDEWQTVAPLSSSRSTVAVTSHAGCLYAVGGYSDFNHKYVSCVEIYDVRLNEWISGPQLNCPRSAASVGCCEGAIYACGGFNGGHFLHSVEVLSYQSDAWEIVPSMGVGRAHFAATVI